MTVRKQIALKRIALLAKRDPHTAMMTLLAKGASFEFAARVVAGAPL